MITIYDPISGRPIYTSSSTDTTGLINVPKVADIAAKDALPVDQRGLLWVADASADPTVESGGALYYWDTVNLVWIKVSEQESMDLSFAWSNVSSKPAHITEVAGLTAADDDIIQQKAGVFTNRTMLQLKSDLNIPAAGMANPMTAAGDIIVGGVSGAPVVLAKGSALQALRMNADASGHEYVTVNSSLVGLGNVTNESKATMFTSPVFTTNVTLPSIVKPATDSSTAIRFTKANGTTDVMVIDTSSNITTFYNGGAIFTTTANMGYNTYTANGVTSFYYQFGSGYVTSGRYMASSTLIDAGGAGGLNLAAYNAAGVIRFWTGTSATHKWEVALNGNLSNTGAAGDGYITLKAGTSSLASLIINPGQLLATAVSGEIGNNGVNLFYTDNTNTRYQLVNLNSASKIASTYINSNAYHGVVARPVAAGTNPLPTVITSTTFTLGATANPISYYYQGTLVTVSANKTATLDDGAAGTTAGVYYVYFNAATGNILATKAHPGLIYTANIIIASVQWNGTDYGLVSDERHNHTRNIDWHAAQHSNIGVRYDGGIILTHNGGTGAAATFATTSGEIDDEELHFVINASSAFPTPNTCRLWWQTGASTYTFDKTASAVPFKIGANSRPVVINSTGYAVTEVPSANNRYVNFFVYAATDLHTPIYIVCETVSSTTANAGGYTNVANARAVPFPSLTNKGFSAEIKPIYRLIVRADGVLQAIDMNLDDYRTVSSIPQGGGIAATNASAIAFNPYGNITSSNVQLALEELDDAITAASGGTDPVIQTLGTSGTQTINRATSDKYEVTPASVVTLAVSDFADLQKATLKVINGGASDGSNLISYPAAWQWPATPFWSASSCIVDGYVPKIDAIYGPAIPNLPEFGYSLLELQRVTQNSVDNIHISHKHSYTDVTGYTPRVLLHMNGDNDGTTFVESALGTAISTGNALPVTKTATKVYGTASAYFNGSTSCLHIGDGSVGLGTKFTVSVWLFPTSTAGRQSILFSASDAQWIGMELNQGYANNVAIWATTGAGWDILQSDSDNNTNSGMGHLPLTLNAWNHVAFVRDGSAWYLFINGQIDWIRYAAGTISEPVEVKKVGYMTARGYYQGYMDELCIVPTKSIWRAPFGLPSTSFLPA